MVLFNVGADMDGEVLLQDLVVLELDLTHGALVELRSFVTVHLHVLVVDLLVPEKRSSSTISLAHDFTKE